MGSLIRKAEEKDIEEIFTLLKKYAIEGLILERDRNDIRNNLNNFLVAELESALRGVISFYDYGENLKEIRSLAVHNEYQGLAIGSDLLKDLITKIRLESSAKIFVLTYSPGFFKKHNFFEVSREEFPEKIWKDCAACKDRENCSETALIYRG